jgi:uncharacterized protein (TIGR02266 family)
LADTNTRQGKRAPVTLKIKFKSETLDQFIERYAVDVSQGGIFIRTKEPLAVGTQMKFEFQLRDASPLIAGEGTVVWTRENDPSRPAIAPGMGVRFDRLADGSQQVLEKILAEKAKQAPQRAHTEQTKPPMFTDVPTRVAPAPVQDALLGTTSGKTPRARSDSEQTPLPKPMPFHSDADEYPEEAFEEATKVRSLDELVAATAEGGGEKETATAVLPRDELAARRPARAETPLAEPPVPVKTEIERESAPGLPSPPDTQSQRKKLDTSPSPRSRSSEERVAVAPPAESPRTKLGVEPAKVATKAVDSTEKVSTAAEAARPHAKQSNAPIVIGVLVVVAAGLAALWFFVLREPAAEKAAAKQTGSAMIAQGSDQTGSAQIAPAGSNATGSAATGSAGSATSMAAGSAVAPPASGVDTVVSSSIAKATIDVEGQTGPAPLTAKLEKGKQYKAHVTAPGFIAKDAFVTGGEKATIKLDPKPHVLTVTSDPAGADIYVEGVATGKQTPGDVNLSAAQAAKPKLHVVLRKAGYKTLDQMVDAATFNETDDKVTGAASGKLEKAPVVPAGGGAVHTGGGTTGGGTTTTGGGAGSATTTSGGTGAGSATTGGGTGAGSATTGGTGAGSATAPTPPTPPASTGSAAATPPAAGGEPEPDWSKKP